MTTGIYDLALDPTTHDLVFDAGGNLTLVDMADLIAQRIRVRLRTQLGEYDFDTSMGVDWRGQVFVKNPDMLLIRSIIVEQILAVPGTREIISLDLTQGNTTRQLTVDFRALAQSGAIIEGTV